MLIILGILFVGFFFFFEGSDEVWSLREDLHLILLGTFLKKKYIIVFYISVGLLLKYCFLNTIPYWKELGLFGEVANTEAGSGKV